MDILIIGNGFDIAHGLLTKYMDFLKFCQDHHQKLFVSNDTELTKEFHRCTNKNIWLKYFINMTCENSRKKPGETWIDFEKEIADIIQHLEKWITGEDVLWKYHCVESVGPRFGFDFLGAHFGNGKLAGFVEGFERNNLGTEGYYVSNEKVTDTPSFIAWIYHQLRDFIRAFEIYCLKINETQVDHLGMSSFDSVLSFNYTNTYERLYGNDETQYCYIHGKAQEDDRKTNLILGIDDRLSDGKENQDFSFVRFKKYYQRIIFKTGSEYKDWLRQNDHHLTLEDFVTRENFIHIVGHSLDRTDYDVLYEFFDNKCFKIIVYYYNDQDFEEKVQKVIQLLAYKGKNGRDELIERVHGSNWSIKFTYLYDEKDGLFRKPAIAANERQSSGF